jgi:hypothetical protein
MMHGPINISENYVYRLKEKLIPGLDLNSAVGG